MIKRVRLSIGVPPKLGPFPKIGVGTILPSSELLNCPLFQALLINCFNFVAMWGRDRRNSGNWHWKYWRHLYLHFHWNLLCFYFSCRWVFLLQRQRPKHKQSWGYVAKEKIVKKIRNFKIFNQLLSILYICLIWLSSCLVLSMIK